MDRLNPEGILRQDLSYHLGRPDHVKEARSADRCLLCCSQGVNEAGLCDLCTATKLTVAELELVERWMGGRMGGG